MNTTQLECFTTLANTLNYVRTADALGLTQPAVSRQIQSLEQELGARLFNRTTRSVSLTQVGAQFLPEATGMLNTYYHSMEWISSFHRSIRHVLRIGYSDPHTNRLISDFLKPLIAAQDNISPELVFDQTDANLQRLTTGQLDLLIGMRDARFADDAVDFRPLHRDGFHCVVAKTHPLALECRKRRLKSVSSADLWPHRQIIDIPPYLLKNFFSRGHHIVPVNDALDNIVCSTASEAYSLVLAGAGFALVPDHLLMKHPDLKFFPWNETPHADFGIYYRKESYQEKTSSVHAFVENAAACFLTTPPAAS